MKKFYYSTLLLMLFLSGCGGAVPNAINGKYYMGGDSNCKRYRAISDNSIMCMDSDGRETGYRNAMSDQELQMHMYQKAQNDKASQDLARQMNETGLKMQEIYAPKNYNVNVYRY